MILVVEAQQQGQATERSLSYALSPLTSKIFRGLGFCEAYMDGWWDEENNNLVALLGLLYRSNASTLPLLAIQA